MAVKEAVKEEEKEEEKVPLNQVITKIDEQPTAALPASAADDYDYGDYEGGGFDHVSVDELAMPFLIVLQSNSPQCKPVKVGGVEGAKAGDFYNSATGELFDGEKGVPFLPCARDHKYVEFFPKEDDGSGGGFVSVRDEDDEQVLRLREEQGQFGKIRNEEGAERAEGRFEPTEFVETYSLIGYTLADWDDLSTMARVTVPFASSKIIGYRNFMNLSTGIQVPSSKDPRKTTVPPMWSHRYRLRTKFKQRGTQSWYIIELTLEKRPASESRLPRNSALFQIGAKMNESFNTGAAKVSYDKMEAEGTERTGDEPF